MSIKRPAHIIAMGEYGTGKSSLLNTMDDPKIVLMFDPFGKEIPYLSNCDEIREGEFQVTNGKDVITLQYLEGFGAEGELRVRIEFYHNIDPEKPIAFKALKWRLATLIPEIRAGKWETLILDSLTYCELACRHGFEYDSHKLEKDTRRWYAMTTHDMENLLLGQFAGLPCIIGIACHIDEDKDEQSGKMVRNPKAPGRLRHTLGSGYDVVRTICTPTGGGKAPTYSIQTVPGEGYFCSTQKELPSPCAPDFKLYAAAPYKRRKTT